MTFFGHLLLNFRLSIQTSHLQLHSGQIILFLLKSHYFRTHFLYMIKYDNISRPPAIPRLPISKSGGQDLIHPLGLTPKSTEGVVLGRSVGGLLKRIRSWCCRDLQQR